MWQDIFSLFVFIVVACFFAVIVGNEILAWKDKDNI